MIIPNSTIYLVKSPLESSNNHQLTFANAEAQMNYFLSLPKVELEKYTYQRKDGILKAEIPFDEAQQYNYVLYQNENHSNKWYFAFITDMQYLSDSVTALNLKTDVFQTWQFDFVYKPCFVEREHVNSDNIGEHTVPENVETGEFIINGSPQALAPNKPTQTVGAVTINSEFLIVFQVTELIGSIYFTPAQQYNKIYSGLKFIAVETASDADKIVKGYAAASDTGTDAIVSIFIAPKEFFAGSHAGSFAIPVAGGGTTNVTVYTPAETSSVSELLPLTTISINSSLDGYIPKNNKLFSRQFNYLYVTNNAGEDVEMSYEDFTNNTPAFYIAGSIGQGCSAKLTPANYKRLSAEVYQWGLNLPKYPVCAWNSDYYTNWLTQNAVNIGIGFAGDALKAISAGVQIGAGDVLGGTATALSAVGGTLAQVETAKRIPNQAHGNTGCSDVNFAWRRCCSALRMSVKAEYARIIDDYFSMFGYKVNRVKAPNVTGRTNWNFVKTIDSYVSGNVPDSDIEEFKSLLNRGITFWHNPATFMDYGQTNNIVS